METIKQKLNLIHLYSEHKVDNVGFLSFSLSPLLTLVLEDYYGRLIMRERNESDLSCIQVPGQLHTIDKSS